MTVKLTILIGVIGSGKTYRANQIVDNAKKSGYNVDHINMADELRLMIWDLLSWRPVNNEEYEWFKSIQIGDVKQVSNLNQDGYSLKSQFKIHISGRKLLQNMGTEVIRKRRIDFWAECWKEKVQSSLNDGKDVVCSDLRFPNELKTALTIHTDKKINKEFLFCNYKSNRYNITDNHESERMAQRILKDGYKDGDILEFDYLWFLVNNTDYMKGE